MRGFDGTNHPGALTALTDGFQGAFLYGGTPDSVTGKDFTAAQYLDYRSHGLFCVFMYEHGADDATAHSASTEYADGIAHAQALLADLRSKGVASTEPVESTCDEHLTAAQVSQAVRYQAGFYRTIKESGWLGPVGAYGFPEFLTAVRSAGVADWFHGCGPRSAQPAWVNVWQDNTGTYLVGGAPDDADWVQIPLPSPAGTPALQHRGDTMLIQAPPELFNTQAISDGGLKTNLDAATAGADGTVFPRLPVTTQVWNQLEARTAAVDALPAAVAALSAKVDALGGALSNDEAVLLAAVKAQPTGGQVDVAALATALAPLLPPDATPAAVGEAVVAAFEAHLAAKVSTP